MLRDGCGQSGRTADRRGDGERAVHPGQPVGQPGETVTLGHGRSAHTVVGHVDHRDRSDVAKFDPGVPGTAVLLQVGQRLGDHEVGRILAQLRERDFLDVDRGVDGSAGGQRRDGRAEALLGQDRRGDAAGQRADLRERVLRLLQCFVEQ